MRYSPIMAEFDRRLFLRERAMRIFLQGACAHGIPGLVNLYGIESPGLTASLAIAEQVVEMIGQP